jgi:hypothetical protein
MQVKHQQRDDDRQHAIAEGFSPRAIGEPADAVITANRFAEAVRVALAWRAAGHHVVTTSFPVARLASMSACAWTISSNR